MIDEIHESADKRHVLRIISTNRELVDCFVRQRVKEWTNDTP